MAGRPKTRKKMEEAAAEAGMSYESYKAKIEADKQEERDRILSEKEKRAEARHLREHVRLKQSELSGWMVNFVSSNMRKHGQAIFESLLADDPKEASRFLTQMMRFAAPNATPPEKAETAKKGDEKRTETTEYEEARRKIDALKKKFEIKEEE